jgi:hypothetical protein
MVWPGNSSSGVKELDIVWQICYYESPRGLQEFAPAIQAGPTILPSPALVFRPAGIGILQTRLVMVSYVALALVLLWPQQSFSTELYHLTIERR